MKKRRLGGSELEVAPLALGGNVFGWTADEPTSFRLLDAFVDAGFNLIDTANIYSKWQPGHRGGESETIIGNWLQQSGKRDRVIVATKVGMEMSPEDKGLSKAYILRAVEESLQRLQIDCIDLYFSHTDDLTTPVDETLEAHTQLVRQGKVRVIGASNFSAERLSEAMQVSAKHGYKRYECLQPLYNLYDRSSYESGLEAVCRDNRIGVASYYGLACGFLTGKYRSEADLAGSSRAGRVKTYMNERGMRILAALDEVAERQDATPAQAALAWVMARPGITAPIASATSVAQLEELMAAAALQLDQTSNALLNAASAAPVTPAA
jgi:aryl-alcohol dehydrogenase-like predicted oxidoreductase